MTTIGKSRLAINGGDKTIVQPFERYNSIGTEEADAARAVIESGELSRYLGSWGPDFYGGRRVQEFERAWASHFNVRHAIAMNSLTSGLIAALGAIGLEPGDEVIVSPWTMCASATSALHWNAIPVFADIEPDTFALDPASIEANITPHTRAIVAVDIFGQSADMAAINQLAAKHGIIVISDTAQAPGAKYQSRFAGTSAAIGGFSLNYHKHIHTGEGGVMVTDDDDLAERMRLIRNHAEAVVAKRPEIDLRNLIGFNFRLGEIEAAIGIEQLKKLDRLVKRRQQIAEQLTARLRHLPGLSTPVVRGDSTHVYYIYALKLDTGVVGTTREAIVKALGAEGVPFLANGYTSVHRLPIFQRKIAYGSKGFPWTADFCRREVDYRAGICPVAERLHDETCFIFEICQPELSDAQVASIAAAFEKVWGHLAELH